jgi:hypothetical protein
MQVLAFFRLLVVGAASLAPVVALAQGAVSIYSDLVGSRCRWDASGKEPGEAEQQTKRCPGLGGATVVINPWHSYNFIGFTWPKHKPVPEVLRGSALGLNLEWRGQRTATGFNPYAAIIRVMFRSEREGGAEFERQVLGVMRVRPGEACAVAFVDMTANAKPYDLARQAADHLVPPFVCGRDRPRTYGVRSRWTTLLLQQKPMVDE